MMRYLLIPFLFLGACSTVDIKSKPTNFQPIVVPDPRPLSLSSIQWKVYNSNDIVNLGKQLSKTNNSHFILFGLDNTNFSVLDNNFQDIFRYILETNANRDFYKNLETSTNNNEKRK